MFGNRRVIFQMCTYLFQVTDDFPRSSIREFRLSRRFAQFHFAAYYRAGFGLFRKFKSAMRTLQVADALTNMRRCKKLSTMRMIGLVINPNKVIYSFFRHRFYFVSGLMMKYLSALDNSDFRKSNAKRSDRAQGREAGSRKCPLRLWLHQRN
jgi:hypothetical protein